MSQNVQLAAMLAPVQAAPKSSRPQTQKESSHSADIENDTAAGGSVERTTQNASSRKNAFDRVLHKRIEKEPAAEQDSSSTEQVTPSADAEAAASSFVWEQLTANAAAMTAAVPHAETVQSADMMPQTASAANGSVLTQAPLAAASSVTTDNALPEAAAEHGQDSFAAAVNQKQKADKMLNAGNSANSETAQKTAPAGLETAAAKTDKVLPVQPQPADKPAADQAPALPQQAVQNTADKPAAIKSPVFAAQPKPAADTTPETAQAAAKLRAGLKTAYQAKPAAQSAPKQPSSFGQAAESAIPAHAAVQVQPKGSNLNIEEAKVTGIENQAAARIRAADAIAASRPAEQIAQSLPAGPVRADQQIRLTLTPPELGTVRITFRQQEGEIIGVVEAQKAQTRRDIEESMPQLMSAMQNQGLQVRRIEVVQWNTPQQGTRDQLSENFNPSTEREFLQQGTSHSNERSSQNGDSSRLDGFGDPANKQFIPGTPDSQEWFSDKGLNLYI